MDSGCTAATDHWPSVVRMPNSKALARDGALGRADPAAPNAGEEERRPAFVQREPHRQMRHHAMLVQAEAGGRHQAAEGGLAQPAPPPSRPRIADVGDGIGAAIGRRRQAPLHVQQFALAADAVANDGRGLVAGYGGQRGADRASVAPDLRRVKKRSLVAIEAIQIAHAPSPRRHTLSLWVAG